MVDLGPQEPLPERKFIDDTRQADPTIMWFWLFFVIALMTLIWGIGSQFSGFMQEQTEARPFLQVTNREISVFLWQHPDRMRVNQRRKSGYLPAFEYLGSVTVDPKLADQYVSAPPQLLFRYHIWKRLLGDLVFDRPIPEREFAEFLEYDSQWAPHYWPDAPEGYRAVMTSLDPVSDEDLAKLPDDILPPVVRQAFYGWRNYRYEGEEINAVQPSVKDLRSFIDEYPNFQRSLWKNLVDDGGARYLQLLADPNASQTQRVPVYQLSPFLRVAYYNFEKSARNN